MKPKRIFYDADLNFRGISIQNLILGILLGLFCAAVIYGFMSMLREVFRVMSFSFARIPEILSEDERKISNLLLASLAMVIGNGAMINFMLSSPQKVFSKRNLKRSRIVTDQVFFTFNFTYWGLRMAVVLGFGLMTFLTFEQIHVLFSVALIFPIIFFLDGWKTIIQVLGLKGYPWMALHFVILLLLSIGLSSWNPINYRSIDKQLLRLNPIVELPHSNFSMEEEHRFYYRQLQFKLLKDEKGDLIMQSTEGERFTLNGVTQEVLGFRNTIREELIPFIRILISADKSLDLMDIKSFESAVIRAGTFTFDYDVMTDDLLYPKYEKRVLFKSNYQSMPGINSETMSIIDSTLPPPPPTFDRSSLHFEDTLVIKLKNKRTLFNGVEVHRDDFVLNLIPFISSDVLIRYECDKNISYQNYIQVLSAHLQAVHQLRKKEQVISGQQSHLEEKAYREDQLRVKEKYPFVLEELFVPPNKDR